MPLFARKRASSQPVGPVHNTYLCNKVLTTSLAAAPWAPSEFVGLDSSERRVS
jgi:hypothetical protein